MLAFCTGEKYEIAVKEFLVQLNICIVRSPATVCHHIYNVV